MKHHKKVNYIFSTFPQDVEEMLGQHRFELTRENWDWVMIINSNAFVFPQRVEKFLETQNEKENICFVNENKTVFILTFSMIQDLYENRIYEKWIDLSLLFCFHPTTNKDLENALTIEGDEVIEFKKLDLHVCNQINLIENKRAKYMNLSLKERKIHVLIRGPNTVNKIMEKKWNENTLVIRLSGMENFSPNFLEQYQVTELEIPYVSSFVLTEYLTQRILNNLNYLLLFLNQHPELKILSKWLEPWEMVEYHLDEEWNKKEEIFYHHQEKIKNQ